MGLMNLLPGRSQISDDLVVSDLDKLVSESVAFRFNGDKHLIKPLDTKTFLAVSEAFSRLDRLREKKQVTTKDLIEGYTELFKQACSTITQKHVESMTQAQVAALMQLIIDTVRGQSQVKKKLEQAREMRSQKIGD